uniref:PepX_C domain-containing protein n=1 Tax=Heterorhabditis bacteriophora TaxID=37862 RepID=A0A1I7WDQ5_HETBA
MAHLEHTFMSTTSYPLKVEIVSPPSPLIIRFTGYNHAPLLQLSWGKLRREPATRRLSPLYPSLSIDLHVRTDTDFHQSFLWLRPAQAYVHHLSGRKLYALPLPICKQTRQGHGAPLRRADPMSTG